MQWWTRPCPLAKRDLRPGILELEMTLPSSRTARGKTSVSRPPVPQLPRPQLGSGIAEGGSAFGKAFPDVTPVRAAGSHDSALNNAFDGHQRSRISPAVDLGVSVRLRHHAAARMSAGRKARPPFPILVAVEVENTRPQGICVLIHKYEELDSRSGEQFASSQKS